MKLHANAALSLNRRGLLCRRVLEEDWTLTKAALVAEVSVRCARTWVGRYRAEGELGLLDRSSAPLSIPHRTSEQRVEAIAALRRLRFTGPEIAETLDMALSTVSGILTRIGMGKLGRLGFEPARRYERERPGELIHIDVKKLGRIERGAGHRVTGRANRRHNPRKTDPAGVRRHTVGWEYVHIAIDDCTRLAYAEVLGDEKALSVVAFLRRAVEFFARHGIAVQQLLTDSHPRPTFEANVDLRAPADAVARSRLAPARRAASLDCEPRPSPRGQAVSRCKIGSCRSNRPASVGAPSERAPTWTSFPPNSAER